MKQSIQSILFALLPVLVTAGPGINPNPNANFDPTTSQGTFGPFVAAQRAAAGATGGPTGPIDERTKQAMQLAISNWMTDTGIVSAFQNAGVNTNDAQQFMGIADGAFKAEVDELSQKAVLDQVIGNDPRVSIANLTLTNGVFQSVVDNLQIMSMQGTSKVNLIDAINQVRCVQILPSIDTYMLVAAEYIGQNAQQRRAVRPDACGNILSSASGNSTAFPNVPGTPNGSPQGKGDGIVTGVPNACMSGVGSGLPGGQTVSGNSTGNSNNGNGNNANGNSAPVASPLPNTTTPQLGGIIPGSGNGNSTSGTAAASGTTPKGAGTTGTPKAGAGTAKAPAKKTKKAKKAATAGAATGAAAAAASGGPKKAGTRLFPFRG